VSIGIPTHDRPRPLARAIDSALEQSYEPIEVVVSNDGRNPEVHEVGAAYEARDPRVRYVRQAEPRGHAANFDAVLHEARGEYFMWLADDDRLDPDYVARCMEALRAKGSRSVVAGRARYSGADGGRVDERAMNLSSRRPLARVVGYYARVNLNGVLYGVARREELAATRFQEVVGGDWLLMAAMAYRGELATLEDVHVHRSLDGLSSDSSELVADFGVEGAEARHHHAFFARTILRQMAREDPVYRDSPLPARVLAGLAAGALVILRFAVLGRVGDAVGRARRRSARPEAGLYRS
jgi:glycosyltransferase involved in cell wall biosynthesis